MQQHDQPTKAEVTRNRAAWLLIAAGAVLFFFMMTDSVWSQFKGSKFNPPKTQKFTPPKFNPAKPGPKPGSGLPPGWQSSVDIGNAGPKPPKPPILTPPKPPTLPPPKPPVLTPPKPPKPQPPVVNIGPTWTNIFKPQTPQGNPGGALILSKPQNPVSQPVWQGGTTTVVPGKVVPGNVVPWNMSGAGVKVNEIDVAAAPPRNAYDGPRFGLTDEEQQKLLDDIKKLEENQAKAVEEDLNECIITDHERELVVSWAARQDPAKAGAIEDTLQRRPIDIDRLRQQLNSVPGINTPTAVHTEIVVAKAKLTNALDDYKKSVAQGASSQEIKAKVDALRQCYDQGVAAHAFGAGAGDSLKTALDQQVALAQMRESLIANLQNQGAANNASATNAINNLLGALVINWPQLPQGEVVVAGPSAVVQGGGADSEMTMTQQEYPELGGVPFVPGQPLPASDPDNAVTSGLLLCNPETSPGTIRYSVDGTAFSMDPGYSHHLPAGRSYQVKFDQGDGRGTKSYWLDEEGTYDFSLENNTWDLWKISQKITIENSTNGKDFHLVIGNEPVTIRARKGIFVESLYPLLVHFDQGKGAEPVARLLRKGTYRVGVTPAGLDVFPVIPRITASKG